MEKPEIVISIPGCPFCGGVIEEDLPNEYGFHCDTCSYPYDEEEKEDD